MVLSLEIARRSGVYVLSAAAAAARNASARGAPARGASAYDAPSAAIDVPSVPAFVERVRGFAAHAERFRRMLERHARPFVAVAYEDLYADPQAELARVFEHLRLPRCGVAAAAATTRKIATRNDALRASVRNWREVCDALDAAALRTPVWHASCGNGSTT